MSDDPNQPDQPEQPDQPQQPDQPNQPEQGQSQDLGGQWQDANESAKTNVGSELTDDKSKIEEASSRAHNERVGSEK